MATTLTVTVSDNDLSRVVHGLCQAYGLEETTENARQGIINLVKNYAVNAEQNDAVNTALDAVMALPPADVT